MDFYHVRITQRSNKSHDETKVDLTEDELRSRFLKPYEKGEPIIINGKTITTDDLERIRISKSGRPADHLIEEIKAEEARSNFVFLGGPSYEWEAAGRAQDVTDDLIKGPPGYRKEEELGWTPLVGQYFGVLKVLLRWFLVTVVIVYLNWCSVVKCLMNSFLIVKAKIPTNSFFSFPNRLVIIDIHFLVLH